MSSWLLGWPNGTLGMLLGLLAGLLIVVQAWRHSPWDIHDESSYREMQRLDLGHLAPSLILFITLLTLLLGIGALDRGVWWPFAVTGDVLGVIVLPWAVFHVLRGAR